MKGALCITVWGFSNYRLTHKHTTQREHRKSCRAQTEHSVGLSYINMLFRQTHIYVLTTVHIPTHTHILFDLLSWMYVTV